MNTYRYKDSYGESSFRELKMVDPKNTPWMIFPPNWKNSSVKGGRSAKQIKKDRKRKKIIKRR